MDVAKIILCFILAQKIHRVGGMYWDDDYNKREIKCRVIIKSWSDDCYNYNDKEKFCTLAY